MQTINIEEETKKLKLEYELYELCDEERAISSTADDVLVYLVDSMSVNDDKRRNFEKQEEYNESRRNIARIVGRAGYPFGLKKSSFYEDDSEFIAWQLRLLDGYHNLLSIAVREVNEDNFSEIFHLCRFAYQKYSDNAKSVAELRRINLLGSEGTYMERTLPDENSLLCEAVLHEELGKIIKNSKGNSFIKNRVNLSDNN